MVASIYKPFSGKALGSLTYPPLIEVENFDFNPSHSVLSSSMIYPAGNFSGLFFTASLMRFVSTPGILVGTFLWILVGTSYIPPGGVLGTFIGILFQKKKSLGKSLGDVHWYIISIKLKRSG
jgi:hypothetical protein